MTDTLLLTATEAAAAPPHRSAVSITWEHDRYGNTTVVVTLDNGDTIWGTGPAKLEAIAAAQRAVG